MNELTTLAYDSRGNLTQIGEPAGAGRLPRGAGEHPHDQRPGGPEGGGRRQRRLRRRLAVVAARTAAATASTASGTTATARPRAASSGSTPIRPAISASPAVAMDAGGDFVVAWESDNGEDGSGYGIFAQTYTAAGVAQGERDPGQRRTRPATRPTRRWRWTRPATSWSPGRATTRGRQTATASTPSGSTPTGRPTAR